MPLSSVALHNSITLYNNPVALDSFLTLHDNLVASHNFVAWTSQTFIICWRKMTKDDISTTKRLLWAMSNRLHNYVILTLKKIYTHCRYNYYFSMCVICKLVKITPTWVMHVSFIGRNSFPSLIYAGELTDQKQ